MSANVFNAAHGVPRMYGSLFVCERCFFSSLSPCRLLHPASLPNRRGGIDRSIASSEHPEAGANHNLEMYLHMINPERDPALMNKVSVAPGRRFVGKQLTRARAALETLPSPSTLRACASP